MNWFAIGSHIGASLAFFIVLLEICNQVKRIADAQAADKLRYKIAEACQIVGILADKAGLFDDPAVIRALDHFADPDRFLDDDLLPWYPETKNKDQ